MLVNCVAYQEGRKIADIPKEAISDYVSRPDCFVWVALKDPEPAELEEMQEEFGLHELAVEDAIEVELEALEARIFEGTSPRANLEALYGLKQKLTVLNHAIDPLLEAVSKLVGGRVPQVCQGTQDYFRDVKDHLERLGHNVDNLRDTVTTAMTVNLAMITLSENEVTKRLAAYAALVAVPTMIAGIYGMNFKNMPELEWAIGYPLALGAMFAIDIYLFFRFRKTGWL